MTIAHELITRFRSVQGIGDATIEQLSAIKGVGLAKATQIKAAFELGKRRDLDIDGTDDSITDPASLAKLIRKSIQGKAKEHFKLVLLKAFLSRRRHKLSPLHITSNASSVFTKNPRQNVPA